MSNCRYAKYFKHSYQNIDVLIVIIIAGYVFGVYIFFGLKL